MPGRNDLGQGRGYVFRLLSARPRSENELRQKLALKGFTPRITRDLTDYFKKLNLINDREFARAWIESRLNKPLGFKAIIKELRQKGIREEIIVELIEQKKASFDEPAAVRELAEKRWSRLKNSNKPEESLKSQLYAYLIRRGFSNEIVCETIDNIIRKQRTDKLLIKGSMVDSKT